MKKENKYSIQLIFREHQDNEDLSSVILLDYFELTIKENIIEVSGFFHENLKVYLEKHSLVKHD